MRRRSSHLSCLETHLAVNTGIRKAREAVFNILDLIETLFGTTHLEQIAVIYEEIMAHLQSSVFKLSKDLIDSIHEEGIVAYTS